MIYYEKVRDTTCRCNTCLFNTGNGKCTLSRIQLEKTVDVFGHVTATCKSQKYISEK